jgi:predicted DsbA family dithiol-disulfide isomerase
MRIDFVSDVVCPWCAIGLASLQEALGEVGGELGPVDLHIQPFQLNPDMGREGEDIVEHLSHKYGMSPEQVMANQGAIRERAAAVGVDFRMDRRSRTWNTFDAHRLLYWAGTIGTGEQVALKKALLRAYFTDGENPADRTVLLREVRALGLDEAAAADVFDQNRFADEVREERDAWTQAGIRSVPAIVINQRHLISGGQPPEVFAQALRQIAQTSAA